MHRAFSLLLVGGLLAGCQTTTTPITESSQPPNYQTRSERVVESLAFCVAEKGKAQCRSQALQACESIKAEAFTNPYSAGRTLRNFNNGDAETRARFKLATANRFMRRIGFGEICT